MLSATMHGSAPAQLPRPRFRPSAPPVMAGYSTGGVLHIVINNQVGFTTVPRDGRSTQHATGVARMLDIPIWHANADDPDAVVAACEMAAEWRAKFHADAVVDIVGYRR